MTTKKSKLGFTLLETVVSLGVITSAVVGPVYLITRGIYSASFSKNRLVATNLAQEGIEAVRTVRENNILCNFLNSGTPVWSWITSSQGSGTMLGTQLTSDTSQTDTIICNGNQLKNPQIRNNIGCGTAIKINSSGQYGYNATADTIFKRCVDITQPSSGEGLIPAEDILDIISTVTWTERNQDKSAVIQERLYNWR